MSAFETGNHASILRSRKALRASSTVIIANSPLFGLKITQLLTNNLIVTDITPSTDTAQSPDAIASTSAPTNRPRRRWFWWSLFWISTPLSLIGLVLWLTVRDESQLTAPLYYATPLPLIVAGLLVSSECLRMLSRRLISRCVLVAAIIIAMCWLKDSYLFRSETPPRESIKLVFWNVNRGNLGYTAIAEEIATYNADIVALVEATGHGQDVLTWKKHLAGYELHKLGSGMMVFVRGQLFDMEPGRFKEALGYRILRLGLPQGEFALTIVDVASDPLLSRRPAFDKINEITNRHPKLPHVMVGDFNTPPDSVHFDRLPAEYTNAFIEKGSGLRETWPSTSPVLHLDQVWGDRKVQWHRCLHGWTLRSDHRPVVVEFSLKQ